VKKIPKPAEWIRYAASDVKKGGEILPAGKRLLPQDTGLAASVGIKTLPVFRRVRMGLFFTGDELVMRVIPCRQDASTTRIASPCAGSPRPSAARSTTTARPRQPAGDARRSAQVRGAMRCDRHLGRRVGRRCRLRQAGVEAEGSLLMWKIAMKPGARSPSAKWATLLS